MVNSEAEAPLEVNETNLKDFVGQPVWTSDRLYPSATPPGVVMGLAWTAMGGSVLFIECINKEPLSSTAKGENADKEERVLGEFSAWMTNRILYKA